MQINVLISIKTEFCTRIAQLIIVITLNYIKFIIHRLILCVVPNRHKCKFIIILHMCSYALLILALLQYSNYYSIVAGVASRTCVDDGSRNNVSSFLTYNFEVTFRAAACVSGNCSNSSEFSRKAVNLALRFTRSPAMELQNRILKRTELYASTHQLKRLRTVLIAQQCSLDSLCRGVYRVYVVTSHTFCFGELLS